MHGPGFRAGVLSVGCISTEICIHMLFVLMIIIPSRTNLIIQPPQSRLPLIGLLPDLGGPQNRYGRFYSLTARRDANGSSLTVRLRLDCAVTPLNLAQRSNKGKTLKLNRTSELKTILWSHHFKSVNTPYK